MRLKKANLIRKQCGLTLLELMIALAGTATIGAAVATLMTGVTYGTKQDNNLRNLVAQRMAIRARLTASVRQAQKILGKNNSAIVLWVADKNDDNAPNLSEIQWIEYDSSTNQLISYAPTDPLTGSDTSYSLSDNFLVITQSLKGNSDFSSEVWASDISGLTFTLNDADPQVASLVSYRITLQAGEHEDIAIGAAAIRYVEVSP